MWLLYLSLMIGLTSGAPNTSLGESDVNLIDFDENSLRQKLTDRQHGNDFIGDVEDSRKKLEQYEQYIKAVDREFTKITKDLLEEARKYYDSLHKKAKNVANADLSAMPSPDFDASSPISDNDTDDFKLPDDGGDTTPTYTGPGGQDTPPLPSAPNRTGERKPNTTEFQREQKLAGQDQPNPASVTNEVIELKDKLDDVLSRLVESDQISLKAAKIATKNVEMISKLDEALTEKRIYEEKMQLMETLINEKNNTVTEDSPYKAWSITISPVAAAGLSATAEVGLAVDTSGQVLLFGSYCTGLKADVSMEVDVVLGQWFKIDNVIGSNFALGIGVDISEPKKATGTRERGGNIELIFNPTREFIGATLSLGYGKGPQLPIDFEVNYDTCQTFEFYRFNGFSLSKYLIQHLVKYLDDISSQK